MATGKEVITDALEDLLEQAAEEPIEATDGQAALRYLNDMMAMWDAAGINLGYTKLVNLGETLTVPDGALVGIKTHLSIFLGPKFDASISSDLITRAKEGWKAILNLIVTPTPRSYPSILPIGSGNESPGHNTGYFYAPKTDAIYSESGGMIALESETGE